MGYIPHVVMPIFKISPRSCGPSWKRGRGSHTNKSWYYTKIYLIKDQVAPEHIWGLIHQGTRPRINPCFRHGYPRTHPGALDISRDLNCLVPDQEPRGGKTGGVLYDPRGTEIISYYWGLGKTSNNHGEALTAWKGLELAKERKVKNITIIGDSSLIVQSIFRQVLLGNIIIGQIIQRILNLKKILDYLNVYHVLRDQNSKVDITANQACLLSEGRLKVGELTRWDLIL
jgi:ribonuclease HI